MKRTIALAYGAMFLGIFFMLLHEGFTGVNGADLAAAAFAAAVFLSQSAFPRAWAAAGRRLHLDRKTGRAAHPHGS